MVASLHTAATPLTQAHLPEVPVSNTSPLRIDVASPSPDSDGGSEGAYVDDFEPPESPLARSGRDLLGAVDDDDDGRGQEIDDDDLDDEDEEHIGQLGEARVPSPRAKFAWRRREIDFAIAKLYSIAPMDFDLTSLGIQLYDSPAAEAGRAAKRAASAAARMRDFITLQAL